MIPKIRMGNDFALTLTIKRSDGVNEDLSNARNLSVQFVQNGAKWVTIEPTDIVYATNGVVAVKIPATAQQYAGNYRAFVKYRKDTTRYLAENCHAFILTECCEDVTTDTTESVDITLSVQWESDGKDGLDAYQLAVKNGEYVGSYAGYQDWLSAKATKVYTDQAVEYVDQNIANTEEYINEQVAATNERIDNLFGDYNIICWGDSILGGYGASLWFNTGRATTTTQILRNNLAANGYINKVINCGIPGQASIFMMWLLGANGAYCTQDFTIPASSREFYTFPASWPVRNTDRQQFGMSRPNHLFSGIDMWNGFTYGDNEEWDMVNPVMINGEKFFIDTRDGQKVKMRRIQDADEPTTIKAGTIWRAHGASFKTDIAVLFWGFNGHYRVTLNGVVDDTASIAEFMLDYERAAEYMNTDKVIFITPYGGYMSDGREVEFSLIKKMEEAASERWGSRYLNLRKYFVDYGLEKAGVTPTAADEEAIANEQIPPSLLADGVHLNDRGHKLFGDKLYEIMRDLGWLTKQGEETVPSKIARAVLPAPVAAGEIEEVEKPVIEIPDSGVTAKAVDNVRITLGVSRKYHKNLVIFADGTIAGDLSEYSVKLMRHCKDRSSRKDKTRSGWRVPVFDYITSEDFIGDDSLKGKPYIEVPFLGVRDDDGNNVSNYLQNNGNIIDPKDIIDLFQSARIDTTDMSYFRTSWNKRVITDGNVYINHFGLGVFRGKRLVSNIARFGVSITHIKNYQEYRYMYFVK